MKILLIKNFSWIFIGNLIFAFSQWLLLLIIARFGSPYDTGIYSLGLAISAPFIMLLNLSFNTLQSTDLTVQYGFKSFAIIRVVGSFLFIIIFSVVLLVSDYSLEIAIVLFLIALNKVIESYSELYYGVFQYKERLALVSRSIIQRGLIGTFSFALGLYFFKKLYIALVFLLIVYVFNFLFFDYKQGKQILRDIPSKFHYKNIKSLLRIGIPLGLVACIFSYNVNLPRLFLEKNLSFEDLGYFSVIFYLVLIIGKFMMSLSSAFLPRMARLFEENKENTFLNILKILILFLLTFTFIAIYISYSFGEELLTFLYGEDYRDLMMLLVLIMIYGLFNYLGFVFEIGLDAMKIFKFRLPIEIVATLACLISCFYFIPHFGLNGGAIVLIISSCIKCILFAALFSLKYREGFKN